MNYLLNQCSAAHLNSINFVVVLNMKFKVALDKTSFQCVFYSIVEIGIREISATNTFAYAYVCLLRYVSNSIVLSITLWYDHFLDLRLPRSLFGITI